MSSADIQQEALLSQGGRAMLCVCIASIQNGERSLIISCFGLDIPLRTVLQPVIIKAHNFLGLRNFTPCCRILVNVTEFHDATDMAWSCGILSYLTYFLSNYRCCWACLQCCTAYI